MLQSSRKSRPARAQRHLRNTKRRARLAVEELEARNLLSAVIYNPAQIRAAYGFNNVTFTSGGTTVKGDGSGETIAIVDAYNDPNIMSDVNTFDQQWSINGSQSLYTQYGASSSFLTVAEPEGAPALSRSWSLEISLDVEWAHAIAPGAKIVLVEAASASFSNLLSAVTYASHTWTPPSGWGPVVAVSMSWAGGEFSGETSSDGTFTSPSSHGVTYVAASGDSGAGVLYPAASKNVLAVGGTTLALNSSGGYGSESAWSGSGGGYSSVESTPSYQSALGLPSRGVPDVAYNADPNSGYYVYDSVRYAGGAGWWDVGGTSAGAPQWAALVAIADQGRRLAGKGSLDGASQTLPTLYSHPGDFHDITSGSNGYAATAGWDPATGLGTPKANLVIADLVAASSSGGSGSNGSGGSGPSGPAFARTAAVAMPAPGLPGPALVNDSSASGTILLPPLAVSASAPALLPPANSSAVPGVYGPPTPQAAILGSDGAPRTGSQDTLPAVTTPIPGQADSVLPPAQGQRPAAPPAAELDSAAVWLDDLDVPGFLQDSWVLEQDSQVESLTPVLASDPGRSVEHAALTAALGLALAGGWRARAEQEKPASAAWTWRQES
jgi:hypothetical protein